jgi:integrase
VGRIAERSLTARQVETETKPGYHADGPHTGLYLQVAVNRATGTTTRSWIFRYTSPTLRRRREMGLGPVAQRKLAEARKAAAEYRRTVLDGRDPMDERDAIRNEAAVARAKRITFDEAVRGCIEAKSAEWKNAKHAQQWTNTLQTYASPTLGKRPVQKVSTDLVYEVLKPIWLTKTETATRLRQRIEIVLDWATARGYREGDNPARLRGALGNLLPKAEKLKKVEHHAAVPYRDIHRFVTALRNRGGVAALGLEFLLLTATRTNEVTAARWEEIDFAAKVWTIPAERMKARREHRVPLCDRAVAILRTMEARKTFDYVFPGHSVKKRGPLSNGAFLAVMKDLDDFAEYTPHGLRSTFRDWAGETTSFANETLELALAHAIKNKAEAAYRRGDQLEKRAALMAQWGQYVETPAKAGTVTPLQRSAS